MKVKAEVSVLDFISLTRDIYGLPLQLHSIYKTNSTFFDKFECQRSVLSIKGFPGTHSKDC